MQKGLTLKAECTIFCNNMQINCKKKSKISTINLDESTMGLIITGKGDNQIFRFQIKQLKSVHKKFIQEGKITLQFDAQNQTLLNVSQSKNQNIQSKGHFQIFIYNACKENLEVLVAKIIQIKKKMQKNNNKVEMTNMQDKTRKKCMQISQRQSQIQINRKKQTKSIFQLVRDQTSKIDNSAVKKVSVNELMAKKQRVCLLQIPRILMRQILQYSGIHLSQRLISKKLQEIILYSITNLKVKQQIDQTSFNKLARWAIKVQGRPKNIKTLKLEDKHDEQVLIKNKAKTLKFSSWKQISSKNMAQLKGLRIYCLELPYQIKFETSHIFGIRLVQLRLKGRDISVRNPMVKDQDILYIIKHTKELRVLQIAYASSMLLLQMQNPQRMRQIRIGTLNKINGFEDWYNFQKFTNLQILSIQNTQKLGGYQDHQFVPVNAVFSQNIQTLQIGYNISLASRPAVPTKVKNFKLIGDHFRNSDIGDFFLPNLQKLDISQCPNVTPQCLQNFTNIQVVCNWNRVQTQYAAKFYSHAHIDIVSVKGFNYC